MFAAIIILVLFYGQSFFREYNQVYKDYTKENTLKLYGMDKGLEIFKYNFFVGTGIGSYGSKYSVESDIYQKYGFDRGMLSILKYATSGIESGVVTTLVENGIIFSTLYVILIFHSFNVASGFVKKKTIFTFFVLYIISITYYHSYHPEFIVTFLMAMCLLEDRGGIEKDLKLIDCQQKRLNQNK